MQLSRDLGWLRAQRSGNNQPGGHQGRQKRAVRGDAKGAVHSHTGRLQKHETAEQHNGSSEPEVPEVKPAVAPEDDSTLPDVRTPAHTHAACSAC